MKNKKKEMSKSRKIKVTNILLFLLLIGISAFVIFRISLNSKLTNKFESIRAAGEPVTFEELNEFYSIPIDVENSAYIILDAVTYYNEPNELNLLPVIGKAELPADTDTMGEETKNIISKFLANNKKSLELLHSTAGLEYGRYPVDFTQGAGTILPHISEIRKCVQMLQLESVLAAENNEPNISFEDYKSICSIARSLEKEPAMISQLVRNAYNVITLSSLEYSMNRVNFTDKQLEEMENLLNEMSNSNGMQNAMFGERCMSLDLILNPNPSYFSMSSAKTNTLWSLPPVLFLYKAIGLNRKDALKGLSITEDAIKILNLPIEQRYNAAKALNGEISNIPKNNVLLRQFIPVYGNCITSDLRNITQLNIGQVAIAIERYRLKNNKLPDSLDKIVPDYIDSIPLDPYDGKELRYKKLDKGFVVYSIGEDQIDDGGKEKPEKNKESRDSTYDITFIIKK